MLYVILSLSLSNTTYALVDYELRANRFEPNGSRGSFLLSCLMLRILLINIGVLNNVTMVIGCEFIPLNRCKASDTGARI